MIAAECICGRHFGMKEVHADIDMIRCSNCGVLRQPLHMSEADLEFWYATKYHDDHYIHSLKHDRKVSDIRLKKYKDYGVDAGCLLLDVGAGNGAFVAQARARGIDAYGVELSTAASCTRYMYGSTLFDSSFPTDHFDFVTVHDVLEHVADPKAFLDEIFRILKQRGSLILDFPNFWVDCGEHHKKKTEHIWWLDAYQLKSLLSNRGFRVVVLDKPIPSKIVYVAKKPRETRPTILVPPGIGDAYWSLVKMEGFLKSEGLGLPDVYISSTGEARDRSLDFVKRIPFLHAARYRNQDHQSDVWREAYQQDGRTLFKDVSGCDYFLAYNGVLRHGKSLDDVDEGWKADWFLRMFRSLEEDWYGQMLKKRYGDYLVGYFVPHGMYSNWLAEFQPSKIFDSLCYISKLTKKKILMIGSKWDQDCLADHFAFNDPKQKYIVDLTGKTTLEQCFGLLRNADGVIGFPSGVTIMSTVFEIPTLMFWNGYFDKRFFWNSCPPASKGNWYDIVNTAHATVDTVTAKFMDLMGARMPLKAKPPVMTYTGPKVIYAKKTTANVIVACVLKSGGDFDRSYVYKLRDSVRRHLPTAHRFVCLSDIKIPGVTVIPLVHDLKGWWSKLELFRPGIWQDKYRIIYFDLDTVIMGDISKLAMYKHDFSMLHRFRDKKKRASGIMAWQGDYSVIETLSQIKQPWNVAGLNDQQFIEDTLRSKYDLEDIKPIQKIIALQSYKNHIRGNGGPKPGTKVVCFHGHPRLHEAMDEPFVKENWK